MDKNLLLEILSDWNFWDKDLDSGIERKLYLDIYNRYQRSNVIVSLIGLRRAGKSFIMRQIIKHLVERGTKREEILFVNFEDPRFTAYTSDLLQNIYETYIENLKPPGKVYIFLDEVHYVPGWEKWSRMMHELGKAKIVVSGSSSKLLSGELATALTGRHLDIQVYPLSFSEYLVFNNILIKNNIDLTRNRIKIRTFFKEYIEWGGFPAIIFDKNKKQMLLTYFDDILSKDIEKRYKVKKTEILRSLSRFYLTNISNLITYTSIAKYLKTATITAEKFSNYLEEVRFLFFIKRFSYSVKEQDNSPRKVYSGDIGLANVIGFRFSENSGRLLENLVAIELRRKCANNKNLEVYYWKNNGNEVDFVIKEGQKVTGLIQVCWTLDILETKNREIKALLSALKKFKIKKALIITSDYEATEKANGFTFEYLPFPKWQILEDKHEA